MSTVYISEFASMTEDARAGAGFLLPQWPPLAKQVIAIGSVSAAFNQATRIIRVNVDATCSINISANGAAASALIDARMTAGTTELMGVQPGSFLSSVTNT